MVGIVEQEIAEARANGITNFIFTGFPRTIGQELEMEKMVARLLDQGAEVNYKNICLLVPEQVSRNIKNPRPNGRGIGGLQTLR